MTTTEIEALADSIFEAVKLYTDASITKRTGLVEEVQRGLLQRVDQLSRQNAELSARLNALEQKPMPLRAVS